MSARLENSGRAFYSWRDTHLYDAMRGERAKADKEKTHREKVAARSADYAVASARLQDSQTLTTSVYGRRPHHRMSSVSFWSKHFKSLDCWACLARLAPGLGRLFARLIFRLSERIPFEDAAVPTTTGWR